MDRISPAVTEALRQLVKDAKSTDILAPVTVIGPTQYANLTLRQELGRTGFVNVRFIVMGHLSELLGAAELAREGRSPLTRVIETMSIMQVLDRHSSLLAPVRGHTATQARVRSCFKDLRRTGEDVLTALEVQGGVRGEVVRLYRAFRQQTCKKWYDSEDLAEAAANAVRSDESSGLADLGLIIFYLPRDPSPAEQTLIEALVSRARCTVLLGSTGDPVADQQATALAESLNPMLGTALPEEPAKLPLLPGEAQIHVAPTAREELRRVVRGILQEVAKRQTPFHKMAVLYRIRDPYAALIHHELQEAGIPVAGPGTDLLQNTASGRTLMGLLDLAEGEFPRARVMAWLTGCPVRPKDAQGTFNPSYWDALTKRAGIVGGLGQWQSRLDHYSKEIESDTESRLARDEITEARANTLYQEAATAKSIGKFIDDLGHRLTPPKNGSEWVDFCNWARGLLDHYLDKSLPSTENAALEKIYRAVEELKAADSVKAATTLKEFRQTVDDALQDSTGRLGVTGQGVFVSSFAAAAGMNFDAIWMVGMIEGAVPPALPPDPLLPEADWLSAGGPSRLKKHIAQERSDYLSAVSSAPRRVLSYPAAGATSNRKAYPSRWLLEQASALEDELIRSSDLSLLADRPWLTIDASPEHALSRVPESSLADLHDYTLQRLLHWKRSGKRLGGHPFVKDGALARAMLLGSHRDLSVLTEFDGNLSLVAQTARFSRSLDTSPISPTRLETWARCPFSYFLGHVLRLSALDTPEETVAISALDRGGLMHKILERFIRDSDTPPPGKDWTPEARARLTLIAHQEFARVENRGVTGKPILWELDKEELLSDLDTFLEEDSTLRQEHGSTSIEVELKFGTEGNTPTVTDAESPLRFRGQIDRVDLTADGRSVLVIDYKTGRPDYFRGLEKDAIDRGKHLQLAIYSLAAREIFPNAEQIRAAYWFATTRGGFRLLPSERFDLGDPQTLERFRQGVTAISDGIRGGAFPANPGPPDRNKNANCTYCDFDAICPSRRADLWDRKKQDPLLSRYLELAEGEEEQS